MLAGILWERTVIARRSGGFATEAYTMRLYKVPLRPSSAFIFPTFKNFDCRCFSSKEEDFTTPTALAKQYLAAIKAPPQGVCAD